MADTSLSQTTNAKVVKLADYQVKHGGDDAGFLHCPKCEGGDWAVICRGILTKPFIAALVCVECDPPTEIGILNGHPHHAI